MLRNAMALQLMLIFRVVQNVVTVMTTIPYCLQYPPATLPLRWHATVIVADFDWNIHGATGVDNVNVPVNIAVVLRGRERYRTATLFSYNKTTGDCGVAGGA